MGLTRTRFSQANTAIARIQDPITVLNNDSTEANVDVGFIINRNHGIKSNAAIYWSESGTEFVTALTDNTGAINSNLVVVSYADIRAGQLFANIGPASDISNVYITGSLIPSANISYDLGSSTNRFATLWLSGNTIVVGSESISVNNGNWTFTTGKGNDNFTLGGQSTFDNAQVGNLTVTTNLTVQGTQFVVSSTDVSYVDSVIELHTQANLAPLTVDDGQDIGLKIHYYKTQDEHAFLGWVNDTGYLVWYDSGREGVGNVFTGNTYGTIKAGGLVLANSTPSTSTTTGALTVAGGAGIAGNLYIANTGDVSANIGTITNNLSTINANISAYQLYANANAVSQQTSIDTLTSNSATQQVSIDSLNANIGAYQTYSNANSAVQSADISNIISTANSNVAAYLLTSTGNIAASDVIVTGNVYGGIVPTAIYKDVYIGTTAVSLSRGSDSLTVDNFNTTGYAEKANVSALATNATKTTVTSNISAGTAYITFVAATAGNIDQNINTALTYDPNSGNLRSYVAYVDTTLSVTGNIYTAGGIFWNGNGQPYSSGSGTPPAGTTGQLQFNNSGSFGGANIKFDPLNGNLVISSTSTSTSVTTGALVVGGGLGITGTLFLNNTGDVSANIGTIRENLNILDANLGTATTNITALFSNAATQATGINSINANLGSYQTFANANASVQATSINSINANLGAFITYANTKIGTNSNSSILASTIYTTSGIFWSGNGAAYGYGTGGGEGDGITYTAGATAPTSPNPGDQWYDTTTNILYYWFSNETDTYWVDISSPPIFATESLSVAGDGTIAGNLVVNSTTAATSTTTGALVVAGGAGIGGALVVGGNGSRAITHTGDIIPSANLQFNLGSATAWYGTFYGVSTQAKYADLAENYLADTEYEPGTVVIFGGSKEVTVTSESHDPRVAGIVSTNPAYLMNAATVGTPIAFTGRVPCRVQGPVEKGTLLVTSKIPGVAAALVNTKFAPGCVIGKSLTVILDNSIQTIEVAVGRY